MGMDLAARQRMAVMSSGSRDEIKDQIRFQILSACVGGGNSHVREGSSLVLANIVPMSSDGVRWHRRSALRIPLPRPAYLACLYPTCSVLVKPGSASATTGIQTGVLTPGSCAP